VPIFIGRGAPLRNTLLTPKPAVFALIAATNKRRTSPFERTTGRANSYQPQGTRTESSIFDDRVASEEAVAEPFNGGQQSGPLVRASRRIDAQQDDAGDRPCLTKDQVTEILVFRQQQATFAMRGS
jgi:hypothetical protein